jgi:hypothetical protein
VGDGHGRPHAEAVRSRQRQAAAHEVASGKLLLTLGTPSSGGGGNGTHPVLQFGNIADINPVLV